MGLTVREALRLPAFAEAKVLAGADGLGREIERVDVVEVPDISDWLRGGEMLVTTAYAIKDDLAAQRRLVEDMGRKGSAALVLKVARFLKEVSPDLLSMADSYSLPLIDLPADVPYTDVTTPVLSRLLALQTVVLEQSAQIHQTLTEVVLRGGGVEAIARRLSEILGSPTLIENRDLHVITAASPQWGPASLDEDDWNQQVSTAVFSAKERRQLLERLTEERRPIHFSATNRPDARGRIIAPIVVNEEVWGYLSLLDGQHRQEQIGFLATEHAATVAALEITKKLAVEETETRLKSDILQDLLSGSFQSVELIQRRARTFNWDLMRLEIALVVDVDDIETYFLQEEAEGEAEVQALKRRLFNVVRDRVHNVDPKAVVAPRSDSVVILASLSHLQGGARGAANRLAVQIKDAVRQAAENITVSIGIGRPRSGFDGLSESYHEAVKALQIGRTVFGTDGQYDYEELGLYRLLFNLSHHAELRQFYNETLEPLEKYDRLHDTGFTVTLQAYLECNGNTSLTAKQLYVHRNTLQYRLKRIEEILGAGLDQADTRLKLLLGLKVKEILDGRHTIQ